MIIYLTIISGKDNKHLLRTATTGHKVKSQSEEGVGG